MWMCPIVKRILNISMHMLQQQSNTFKTLQLAMWANAAGLTIGLIHLFM